MNLTVLGYKQTPVFTADSLPNLTKNFINLLSVWSSLQDDIKQRCSLAVKGLLTIESIS